MEEDPLKAADIYNLVMFEGDGEISSLSEAITERYLLNIKHVKTFLIAISFSELRIRCFKPSHRCIVHMVLKGDFILPAITDMIDMITGLCGNTRFLSDDNSHFGANQCSHLRIGSVNLYTSACVLQTRIVIENHFF